MAPTVSKLGTYVWPQDAPTQPLVDEVRWARFRMDFSELGCCQAMERLLDAFALRTFEFSHHHNLRGEGM